MNGMALSNRVGVAVVIALLLITILAVNLMKPSYEDMRARLRDHMLNEWFYVVKLPNGRKAVVQSMAFDPKIQRLTHEQVEAWLNNTVQIEDHFFYIEAFEPSLYGKKAIATGLVDNINLHLDPEKTVEGILFGKQEQ